MTQGWGCSVRLPESRQGLWPVWGLGQQVYILPPRGIKTPPGTGPRSAPCGLSLPPCVVGGRRECPLSVFPEHLAERGLRGWERGVSSPQPPQSSGQRASTRSSSRCGWQVTGLQSLCPFTWKMKGVIPSPAPRDYEDKMRIFWQVISITI